MAYIIHKELQVYVRNSSYIPISIRNCDILVDCKTIL